MCRDQNFGRDRGPGTSRDQPGPGQGPGPGTMTGTALLGHPTKLNLLELFHSTYYMGINFLNVTFFWQNKQLTGLKMACRLKNSPILAILPSFKPFQPS